MRNRFLFCEKQLSQKLCNVVVFDAWYHFIGPLSSIVLSGKIHLSPLIYRVVNAKIMQPKLTLVIFFTNSILWEWHVLLKINRNNTRGTAIIGCCMLCEFSELRVKNFGFSNMQIVICLQFLNFWRNLVIPHFTKHNTIAGAIRLTVATGYTTTVLCHIMLGTRIMLTTMHLLT